MGRNKRVPRPKYPFDPHPFEALCCGSWQSVEHIRICSGEMTIQFVDPQHVIKERGPVANLRLRSRRATLADCTCFLRPGIDVCVFLPPKQSNSSAKEDLHPVWIDAKISSIERRPHETQCTCQFYVNPYITQAPLGSEQGMITKETNLIGIEQISILQKLEKHPREGQHFRWDFSQDCSTLPRTKLLLGKFLCDLSWLLVASVQKHVAFDVRSMQDKIVYRVMEAEDCRDTLKAISFRVEEDGVSTPVLVKFPPPDEGTSSLALAIVGPLLCNEPVDLRRSKRRYVQPDRFLACDGLQDDNAIRTGTFRAERWIEQELKYEDEEEEDDDDDMLLPLSCLFGTRRTSPAEYSDSENPKTSRKRKGTLVYKRKKSVPKVTTPSPNNMEPKPKPELAMVPFIDSCPIEVREAPSSSYYINRSVSARKNHDLDHRDRDLDDDIGIGNQWGAKASNRKAERRKYHTIRSRRGSSSNSEAHTYTKRTLSAGAYNDLINSYMRNIDSTVLNKEDPGPLTIPQWRESEAKKGFDQREEDEECSDEDEGESETEMLWKEMEMALASASILEDNEDPSDGTEGLHKSSNGCRHDFKLDEEVGIICRLCGIVSTEIKDVSPPFAQTQHNAYNTDNKRPDTTEDPNPKVDQDNDPLYSFRNNNNNNDPDNDDMPSTEETENVWALIPELRRKLHLHQKKAFEFLWKNIAGSLEPASMKKASNDTGGVGGGCVVSHTPGAGKTFLIIAFLVSYLKLFPGKRPLILAPKTTLYTWYKEFIKWEIPIPVHLIHGRRTFSVSKLQTSMTFRGPKPSNDVMHVLDCLEKIQKWHAFPSVLVMGYTSFLTLMREDSKFEHRKYMARVLRESPGILILDEGHNPRSTKSRCRKVLMKVETELRILLSGTLFQNNFCEYFNTLCLARPKFMDEVLKELDKSKRKPTKKAEKARHLIEARARKFFLDNIAKKIDSSVGEERLQGLNMLRNITNGFIDVYEGAGSDNLPGLQSYTLLMNSTNLQHEMLVKLHSIMAGYSGYPLELELLITLASIHPSLVRTSNCASKFFTREELEYFESIKFDYKRGSKVIFVLNLVFRVCENEKVLIFCHNIAPINLFIRLFEDVFHWRKGKEVLVLTGDLELFERGKVMDKFEEPGGPSKILLASITACAEGVSLTAASRVVLLDSEWNPSKTKQAIARAFRPGQMKVVYVYQLLATGTLEEDKYRRTTWKEWVSNMIFSEAFVEDPSRSQTENIEDDILRDMVEVDRVKSIHMIMKNEKKKTL